MKNHFDQLVNMLDANPGAMDAITLHGFLTALAIGPNEAIDRPWLQEILNLSSGKVPPDNIEELEYVVMLALAQILDEIAEIKFRPRMEEVDTGHANPKAWCRGFQQAVALAGAEWEALHDECPDAARKGVFIAAFLQPELAESMFGIPQNEHDAFVTKQASLLGPAIDAYYQELLELGVEGFEDIGLEPPTLEDLPRFSKEELAAKSDDELFSLLTTLDDAVPREVVYECMGRDASMVEKLNRYLADDKHWDEEQGFGGDSWWTRLHAIMILGGVSGEMAGQGLISAFRHMSDCDGDSLWDWLAGYWPALFHNKPETINQALHTMAENAELDWYMRHHATECILACAAAKDQEALEQALDWVADLIAAEGEDEEFCYMEGCTLLDFARERHRPLLEKLADLQESLGICAVFVSSDVNQAFSQGTSSPEWERFDNPWEFYEPKKILERQQRWHSEDIGNSSFDEEENPDEEWRNHQPSVVETYAREQPKVGRNDPCPCGSGKKYKKCCLH